MKKLVRLSVAGAFVVSAAMVSCSGEAGGDKAKVDSTQEVADAKGKTLRADLTQSTVGFTGFGVGKSHPGTFRLKDGWLSVKRGEVTGGKFTIDINSMAIDEPANISDKLRPHLLSADFFEAEKYPAATFEITDVKPYTPSATDTSVVPGANYSVSGNFTLKGVTKNITFPAKIVVNEKDYASAQADFVIDRTLWNMNWGNDRSLGNKFISEDVNLRINLVATDAGGAGM